MKQKFIIFIFSILILINPDHVFSQMSLQWAKKFNGDGGFNYNDRPVGTVMDSQDNLIITGSSYDQENSSFFYITVKYDPSGNIIWSARLDTISGIPYGITTDMNDNIYITGGGSDFTVIKYSAAGDLKWVIHERSPFNGIDGQSVITNNNGNVYVTGPCAVGSDVDCLTVKYDSNGVRQWYTVYNHPSNNSDYPSKIILDNQNNVYVIGYTYVSGGGSLATTLKYNDSGNLLWASVYDGASYEDYVNDIVVDNNNNVYVTGESNVNHSQNDYDFFTIKYDSNGDSLWVRKFDGPGSGNNGSADLSYSLKVSNNKEVIVSGKSKEINGDNDVRVIKYSSEGNELWNRHFNYDSLSNDIAYSMELDENNNIFLVGKTNEDYLIIKCDSYGNLIWKHNYDGITNGLDLSSFINADMHGNPIITGFSNRGITAQDYLTIKYDTSGSLLWMKSFTTSAVSNDVGNCLATDQSGNIFVTGKTQSLNGNIELITLKYNSYGNLVWNNKFNYMNSIYNEGISNTADRYGNSFVSGYIMTSDQHKKLVTLKYDSSGVLIWTSIYSGMTDNITIPRKVILDEQGNVYVCGLTYANGQGYDLLVIKYNAINGDTLWVRTFNNTYNDNEDATDIFINSENNILISGYTTVSSNNTDYLLIKFDDSGNLIWFRTYDKLENDIAYSVKSDISGNIYITGRTHQITSIPPYYYSSESYTATLKYDSEGNIKWTATNGNGCFMCTSENSAYDLTIDGQYNVIVTGENTGRYKTIKYDSLGNMQWVRYYNSPYSNGSKATNIVIDGNYNIFVSGRSPTSQNKTEIVTLKYNNVSGNQDWINIFNNYDDIISKMIIDTSDNIFMTGYSQSNETGSDILILKYSDGTIGINSNNLIKNIFSLWQNYPNPFNPSTMIRYSLSGNQLINLKVYDILGKEVATLVNEKQIEGSYEVEFDGSDLPSGVYFYKLEAGEFVETKRMILLK